MKKRSLLLPLMFISAIALGGCSDDKDALPDHPDDTQGSISAPADSENMIAPAENEPTSKLESADPLDPAGSEPADESPEAAGEVITSADIEQQ